jgi:hypothetical protein
LSRIKAWGFCENGSMQMPRRSFLTLPALALAQEPEGRPLFDGRTLRGWSIRQGPESAFYAEDGAIVVGDSASFPAWLRYDEQFENYDFRGEFLLARGWADGGIYLNAPEYGPNTNCGLQWKIFHEKDKVESNGMGAIYPLLAPQSISLRAASEWQDFRIQLQWPRFQAWLNGVMVQDVALDQHADLRWRLRKGYIGLASLGYPLRFRNLRVRELPGKLAWEEALTKPEHLAANWFVGEGNPKARMLGDVLRMDGNGHLTTKKLWQDFAMQCYIRGMREHNGGINFRSDAKGLSQRHYEIQLHSSEEAHFPTGSLYHFRRSRYPRIQHEEWFLYQMWVQGSRVVVRINGENVTDYNELSDRKPGHIELQAHRPGWWTEFRDIRIRAIEPGAVLI